MPDPSTLLKLGGPLLGIGVLLLAARLGRLKWVEDLGMVAPPMRRAVPWVVAWLGCIALAEALRGLLGLPDPPPWEPYPLATLVLRVVAIGVAGPILEELLVRGILFGKLSRTRLGPAGAIVLLAVGWALVHSPQDVRELGFIAVDGVILGAARWHTRSVLVPCAMHIVGNCYSIGQSLGLV